MRFSVDADFEREPSLVVANYLLHLQAVVCKTDFSLIGYIWKNLSSIVDLLQFLDALDAASQIVIQCKPVVR